MHSNFRLVHSLEKRQNVSKMISEKYPEKIPVIAESHIRNKNIKLDRSKFLVPSDIVLNKFVIELRKHIINLNSHAAIYPILEDGTIPPLTTLISTIYNKNRNIDGFLYITLCEENTFG